MKLEKKRYVRIIFEREGAAFTEQDAKHAIYESVMGLWGEAGASVTNAQLVEFEPLNKSGIISCSREGLEKVFASLALKTRFNNQSVALRPILVSGTIASLDPKPWPNRK
jgi:RNase P/RNase MRP subunit POP5